MATSNTTDPNMARSLNLELRGITKDLDLQDQKPFEVMMQRSANVIEEIRRFNKSSKHLALVATFAARRVKIDRGVDSS